jgi:Transposase
MARITVGVDVGKEHHQAAAYDPAADRIIHQVKFAVSHTGFARVLTFLGELGREPTDLVVGLEATGHYHLTLAEFLAGRGCASSARTSPNRSSRRSQSARRSASHAAATSRPAGSIQHVRTRPTFSVRTSRLRSRTYRCWTTAASVMSNGRPSSETDIGPSWLSRATSARRVRSPRASKTRAAVPFATR